MAIIVSCDKTECIYNEDLQCSRNFIYLGELRGQTDHEMYCENYTDDEEMRDIG